MPAQRILEEAGALVETAQAERAEIDIPFAVSHGECAVEHDREAGVPQLTVDVR